jgi:glycosyltransferase involved in cell wall biosynthesis
MRPPLAICIPTYARAGTLERLLSTLAREAPGVPLLVSDNASPDGTPDVLRRAARPGLEGHRHAENLGAIANIRWLLSHAPDAEHVWMICDDDLPAPGSVAAVRQLVAAERPAWLHLPHHWIDASGTVVNESPCPAAVERYDGSGALYRTYGHWLTFGSAAVVRRDALALAAARVATANAYAPLVWFVSAAGDGPCLVAPFVGVQAGTEITWADRVGEIVGGDYPALYEEVLSRHVDATAFAASLDHLYGSDWGADIWRTRSRDQIADVHGRFPRSRVLRRIAVERAAADHDASALEQLHAAISGDERAEAAALRLLGETAYAAGDVGAALDLLSSSVLADPLEVETWSDLGVVRHALGGLQGAVEALSIGLAMVPGHEDSRANLDAISSRLPA